MNLFKCKICGAEYEHMPRECDTPACGNRNPAMWDIIQTEPSFTIPLSQPEPKPKPQPKPQRQPKPEPQPQLKPEPQPQPKPKPQPKPQPQPEPIKESTPKKKKKKNPLKFFISMLGVLILLMLILFGIMKAFYPNKNIIKVIVDNYKSYVIPLIIHPTEPTSETPTEPTTEPITEPPEIENPVLNVSAEYISLYEPNKSEQIICSYTGYDKKLILTCIPEADSKTSTELDCEWGEWKDNSVSLTFTAQKAGSWFVKIEMKDADTKAILDTKTVHVVLGQNTNLSAESRNISARNVANGGIVAYGDGFEFFTVDDGCTLSYTKDGNYSIIFEKYGYRFSNLIYENETLYYLYNGYAYALDMSSGSAGTNDSVLESLGGSISRLYLTDSYYFIYSNAVGLMYRVNRKSEKVEESMSLMSQNQFIVDAEQNAVYFIERASYGSPMLSMVSADNFNNYLAKSITFSKDNTVSMPICYGNYVYVFNKSSTYTKIVRLPAKLASAAATETTVSWDITTIKGNSGKETAFYLNVAYPNLVFIGMLGQTDTENTVYMLNLTDDGKCKYTRLGENAMYPNVTPYGDSGNIILEVLDFFTSDTLETVYFLYDKDGNRIEN